MATTVLVSNWLDVAEIYNYPFFSVHPMFAFSKSVSGW